MEENKPTFEKIDKLTKEHMYGNMTDTAYLERKHLINQRILDLTNVLLDLRNAENNLH